MKKILIVIVLLALILISSGCVAKPKEDEYGNKTEDIRAIITCGSVVTENIQVKEYLRISSGWIQIIATDGRIFCTNEHNVLIIKNKTK